jgi:hypothetical protein
MSQPEMFYLGFTLAAFATFAVVLFAVSTWVNLKR